MEKTAMQLCNEAQFKEWVEEKVPDEVWEMDSSESVLNKMIKQLDENQNGKKK